MKILYKKDVGIIPGFGSKDSLLHTPVVIYVNSFTERTAKEFMDKISEAHNTGQTVIPVIIDSYGGVVHSLITMMSCIDNSKIPVATIGMGKNMSCGAVLLGYGDSGYRYACKDTRVMMHDVAAGARGKIEDMKVSVKEADLLSKKVFQKLAIKCNHKDKNYFLNLLEEKKHLDFFMDTLTAKKHKLVDHVGVPDLQVDVKLEMGLYLD